MARLPDWLDRALRGLLGLPGQVLERLDGGARVAQERIGPEDVFDQLRATARHPESRLGLEDGLHYHLDEGLVLAWQLRGRTAFAVGGLNAPPGGRGRLLRSFRAATAAHGVARQLVFPVRADEVPEVEAAGFSAVQVGVEAWLDLPGLGLRGKRFENVRQMCNRARRRGVRVEEVDPRAWADELAEVHAAWLRGKRPAWRMKLLVGSPSLERPFDRRYVVARTPGRVEAFLTVLPGPPGVWGVDVMCRRPDAPPGTMERLLVTVAERLRDEGALALSLGACPMAGVPRRGDRPMLRQVFHALYTSSWGNRLFGFRSLAQFKDKLRPRWEPVYFAASPSLGWLALYRGCRMWGLY